MIDTYILLHCFHIVRPRQYFKRTFSLHLNLLWQFSPEYPGWQTQLYEFPEASHLPKLRQGFGSQIKAVIVSIYRIKADKLDQAYHSNEVSFLTYFHCLILPNLQNLFTVINLHVLTKTLNFQKSELLFFCFCIIISIECWIQFAQSQRELYPLLLLH